MREGPPDRLILIMEAHDRLLKRKQARKSGQKPEVKSETDTRVHANVDPDAAPEVKQAVVAMVEHVAATMQEESTPEDPAPDVRRMFPVRPQGKRVNWPLVIAQMPDRFSAVDLAAKAKSTPAGAYLALKRMGFKPVAKRVNTLGPATPIYARPA